MRILEQQYQFKYENMFAFPVATCRPGVFVDYFAEISLSVSVSFVLLSTGCSTSIDTK